MIFAKNYKMFSEHNLTLLY